MSKEPTEDMIEAGGKEDFWHQVECQENRAPNIYKAMITTGNLLGGEEPPHADQ